MGAWSTASLASRRDEEARPKRVRASARSSGLESSNPCAESVGKKDHQVRRSKVK
jgi:hypothetical protein